MKKRNENNQIGFNDKNKYENMINLKYLKDNSYQLFDDIFNDIEFEDIKGKIIKINDYHDFKQFIIDLNSNYLSTIKEFEYTDYENILIIKEIPYKPTRLRKISKEDTNIIISPNGMFAKALKIKNNSESALEHYNTIIGNSIMVKGVYYYEMKILDLGDDSDLYIGIISKDCQIFENKYKNFPLVQFDDGFGIDLNKYYQWKNSERQYLIKNGDVILVKIDLDENNIIFYINGKNFKNHKIQINNKNCGYYPAFSLSTNKEILVNFGGVYSLEYYSKEGTQFDVQPICQYNNLEKIINCYIKIIENNLLKIINHPQISYNDSIRFFYPMLKFFGKIAFKDEYIMKNYIIKFMYKNEYNKIQNIYKFFDERYNLIYLILQTMDLGQRKNNVLFMLNCLCEEIKYYSYLKKEYMPGYNIWLLLLKLYNYFLNKKLIQEILFEKDINDNIEINNQIKNQLFSIFQPIIILEINYDYDDYQKIEKITKEFLDEVDNNIIKNYLINSEEIIEIYSEILFSLLNPILQNENLNIKEYAELNAKYKSSENYLNYNYNILKNYIFKSILNQNLLNEKKENTKSEDDKNYNILFENKRALKKSNYRIIFFELIKDIYNSDSNFIKFNFIMSIFFPLLNLFIKTYKEEKSLSLIDKQILSFLPFYENYNIYGNSKIFLSLDILNKNDDLKEVIDNKILSYEIYKKEYNISSYILNIIIKLFSFFNDDFYLHREIDMATKKLNIVNIKEKENFILNNYYSKYQKYLFFYKNNVSTMPYFINIIIMYFNESVNNNFYLLFPSEFIKGIEFLIEYLLCQLLLDDLNSFDDFFKLINLLKTINFNLLNSKNINKKYLYEIFIHLIELFEFFDSLNSNEYKPKIREIDDKNYDFNFNENEFETIFNLIKDNYNESNIDLKKKFEYLIMVYSCEEFTYIFDNFSENFIKNLKNDNSDFWLNTFIIDVCFKRKIINKINKIYKIINNNKEINEGNATKLSKYIKYIYNSLCFVLTYLIQMKIENFIINRIQDSNFNINEESNINIELMENDKYPLYSYSIKIIILIIKKLLTEDFILLYKNGVFSKLMDFNIYCDDIIQKSLLFLEMIMITIPNYYQDIIINNKEEKSLKKIKVKKIKKKDLEKYHLNIIHNIKKYSLANIICLLEKHKNLINNINNYKNLLKKLIANLDKIKDKYNIDLSDSEEENGTCPICLENYSDCHVSPCGHLFCWDCIQKFKDERCPICREEMTGVLEHQNFKFPKEDNLHPQLNIIFNNRQLERLMVQHFIEHWNNNN